MEALHKKEYLEKEKAQIEERLENLGWSLDVFEDTKVMPKKQHELMRSQYESLESYLETIKVRIENWDDEIEKINLAKTGMFFNEGDYASIYSFVEDLDLDAWFLPIASFTCHEVHPGTGMCEWFFTVEIDEEEIFATHISDMVEENRDLDPKKADIKDFMIQGMYMYICKLLKENGTIKAPNF